MENGGAASVVEIIMDTTHTNSSNFMHMVEPDRGDPDEYEPLRLLGLAVIAQAFRDLRDANAGIAEKKDARRWLSSNSYSFLKWCEIAELDHLCVEAEGRKAIENERSRKSKRGSSGDSDNA